MPQEVSTDQNQDQFVHLHLHTHYSMLDGMSKIPEVVEKAKADGSPAVAVTDHGVMHGVIQLQKECEKQDIKPIIGCEVYLIRGDITKKDHRNRQRNFHLTLLAKNEAGYKNLMKMVTIGHLEGFYYNPRINREILAEHSEGLICLSGCLTGEVATYIQEGSHEKAKETIEWHRDQFGEDYYLEVQHHPKNEEQKEVNEVLKDFSEKLDIPLVLTTDAHYIDKEDADAQDVLTCIQTGAEIDDTDRFSMKGELYDMKSPTELYDYYQDDPQMTQALRETVQVAEKVDLKIDLSDVILPDIEIPEGETYASFLKKEVFEGLKKEYGDPVPEEPRERAEYELSIIDEMGYNSYFLIVADYIEWAKNQDIAVGPGRGSAAGSLVSYALGITGIDPLEHNLLFERFLNPERVDMPDIDIDFEDERRDEVIEYVTDKFGEEKVAQIITFGTMASRAAVRDVGRALGMSYGEVDKIAKMIPPPIRGYSIPIDDLLGYDPDTDKDYQNDIVEQAIRDADDLRRLYKEDDQIHALLDLASKLEGTVRHASTHAAGVVIGKKELVEYTPLQLSTTGGEKVKVSHYEMDDLEDIGLLKMDFLGLKNLTIIQDTLRILEKTQGIEIDIEEIPRDDEQTFELLSEGLTTGVFQFESQGMARNLKQLQPTKLEDLIAMNALYRPGPMESIPDFIDAKHGRKEIEYLHPSFEPILDNTYGVITYQEQVFEIAREFAGFTYGEADILRKAMGKKIPELMEEQKSKFIEGALDEGHTEEKAEEVWKFIKPFAEYGFNKSHSASYSLIAYQTAYLKANYPAEFMAALMKADQGNTDKLSREIDEAERLGLEVLPPDLNESFTDFTVVKDTNKIRFGLSAIKNVGNKVADLIEQERKENGEFESLADFAMRVEKKVVNKKTLESLIKAGVFDEFGERNALLESISQISDAADRDENQMDMFGEAGELEPEIRLPDVEPASDQQKLSWEKELLGTYVSDHPLADYEDEIENRMTPLGELGPKDDNKKRKVAGMITSVDNVTTKNGEPMCFAEMEDLTGTTELVVFPDVLRETDLIEVDSLVAVDGKVNIKDEVVQEGDEIEVEHEVKIVVNEIWPLQEFIEQPPQTGGKSNRGQKNNKNHSREKSSSTPTQSKSPPRELSNEVVIEEQEDKVSLRLPKSFTNGKLHTLKEVIEDFEGEKRLILKVFHQGQWKKINTDTYVEVSDELKNKVKKV